VCGFTTIVTRINTFFQVFCSGAYVQLVVLTRVGACHSYESYEWVGGVILTEMSEGLG